MAGAAHTMPVIPQAPKRAERASFKKDMKKIASTVQKLASKSIRPSTASSTDQEKSKYPSQKAERSSYTSSRTSMSTFCDKSSIMSEKTITPNYTPSSTPTSTTSDRTSTNPEMASYIQYTIYRA